MLESIKNKHINICHISTAHSVKDIRIFYKECISLANAGFEVSYIVSHERAEIIDGVNIITLPFTSSRTQRIFKHTVLAFKAARRLNARLYHLHDPELLPAGWLLRILGKKVIYDAHEHVSKDILDKPWIQSKLVRKVVSLSAGLFEQLSARVFSGVVAATSHIAEQFNPSKTAVVRNFPILSFIAKVPQPASRNDGKRRIIYAGALTRIRGIVQLVNAMEFVPDDLELVLAGQWEDPVLEQDCLASSGWNKCTYQGLLPQQKAYELMKGADAGILTFLPAANHFEAMPNKAFEYIACGLPIVISDFPYWRELFHENAIFVDPSNPEAIAAGIIKALSQKADHPNPGRPGKVAPALLSWETEENTLIEFYKKILSPA